MDELPKTYDHTTVEDKINSRWEKAKIFNPDYQKGGEPFGMVFPPANVTGALHLGHALTVAIQDIIIRFRRMQGFRTLYIPGTDHAAIATQTKVESELYKKTKKTRRDFSRDEFLRLVEEYAMTSQTTILRQLKRLGASVDWSRLAYTLDEKRTLAVRTAFKRLFEQGLIYRGVRLVNWDPKLQTNVSDDEIEWKEETTAFYYLKYGPFTIGTARPETKFGDKYVVMHPNDPRYSAYRHGQTIEVEWINGPVTATVIKDDAIDMEFGTGVMTITPAHDATDYEIAKRHGLDAEPVIDLRGCLLPIAGEFTGQHISKARPAIVEKLRRKGLLVRLDPNYTHRIATNSRGGGQIEPQIREQWFIAVDKPFQLHRSEIDGIPSGSTVTLKQLMRHVVQSGQIRIIPGHFAKTYYHWIDNLRDWCISRQIVFGHQVPVWYKKFEKPIEITYYVHGTTLDNEAEKASGHFDVELSELGLKQSQELHDIVKNETFDAVFSSDLKRAQATALIAFGSNYIPEQRLREADYGELTRSDNRALEKKEKEFINSSFPKGESYRDVERRMRSFLSDVRDKYAGKRIAIVGHKAPQLALEVLLKGKSWEQAIDEDWRKNKAWRPGWHYMLDTLTYVGIHPPTGEGWQQDQDTLDTWFSSGLWTFSTLGWPESTSDLRLYHPNAVMETGYDILFFWVARMILMSCVLLGQVPFRTVYLHGLVRDAERQKMSKSKGNSIDPLGVIEQYGTDALRFALVFSTAAGNDIRIDEDKIRGMKHFANKLWNIARYILTNTLNQNQATSPGLRPPSPDVGREGERSPQPATDADKDILQKLQSTIKTVTENLENFRLQEAAQAIYDFTWHEFADKYIEASKSQMKDSDLAENTKTLLLQGLEQSLKLLHPFMPFITEHIWSLLKQNSLLATEQWPKS